MFRAFSPEEVRQFMEKMSSVCRSRDKTTLLLIACEVNIMLIHAAKIAKIIRLLSSGRKYDEVFIHCDLENALDALLEAHEHIEPSCRDFCDSCRVDEYDAKNNICWISPEQSGSYKKSAPKTSEVTLPPSLSAALRRSPITRFLIKTHRSFFQKTPLEELLEWAYKARGYLSFKIYDYEGTEDFLSSLYEGKKKTDIEPTFEETFRCVMRIKNKIRKIIKGVKHGRCPIDEISFFHTPSKIEGVQNVLKILGAASFSTNMWWLVPGRLDKCCKKSPDEYE